MARAERSGFRRRPPDWRDGSGGDLRIEIDDALRAIVRALARQAAQEVFERESQLEPDRGASKDTP
jgi:hypothetical protein